MHDTYHPTTISPFSTLRRWVDTAPAYAISPWKRTTPERVAAFGTASFIAPAVAFSLAAQATGPQSIGLFWRGCGEHSWHAIQSAWQHMVSVFEHAPILGGLFTIGGGLICLGWEHCGIGARLQRWHLFAAASPWLRDLLVPHKLALQIMTPTLFWNVGCAMYGLSTRQMESPDYAVAAGIALLGGGMLALTQGLHGAADWLGTRTWGRHCSRLVAGVSLLASTVCLSDDFLPFLQGLANSH